MFMSGSLDNIISTSGRKVLVSFGMPFNFCVTSGTSDALDELRRARRSLRLSFFTSVGSRCIIVSIRLYEQIAQVKEAYPPRLLPLRSKQWPGAGSNPRDAAAVNDQGYRNSLSAIDRLRIRAIFALVPI